ncbi:MAG: hypothetical protein GYB37_13405 [Algicola sp.]|nr:hypothetical protein [Algicola sp.]
MHSYLHFFFTQLFAEVNVTYDHAHHIHPNFQNIINEYTIQIDNKLEAIFNAYTGLNPAQKQIVRDAYSSNIDIENICNTSVSPVKYAQLPASISTPIKSLYDQLWGDSKVLGYVHVVASCGTVKSHFNDFRIVNKNSVCPFCGLEGLECEHDDGRDDYDHYLHKSKYPFISVHFMNLVPMCHKCNSKSKGQKDAPFNGAGNRRPIYFPFEGNPHGHCITLSINSTITDLGKLASWTLDINCQPAANVPKKDAWVDIFNIEKRYKARLAKDSYHYKDKLLKEYKKKSSRNGFDFAIFRDDKLDDLDDIYMQKEGIIWKTFHEFVLNDPDFENNVNGVI